MLFYLDEDIPIQVAPAAMSLGLDVTTTHACGRLGSTDTAQLDYAAREGRCLVTRNRDDFIRYTRQFQAAGRPHTGVLLVQSSFMQDDYGGIGRALVEYEREHPDGMPAYMVDFLRAVPQ